MLQVGDHISYVLLPKDLPVDPNREYHGVITALCPEIGYVHVTVLDEGYEGLDEWVSYAQIRGAKPLDNSGFGRQYWTKKIPQPA